MRASDREHVALPDLDGIDGARLATSADLPALRRIARGAIRGSLRYVIPRAAVVVVLGTLVMLVLTDPGSAVGYLVAVLKVILCLLVVHYGTEFLYLQWLLARTLGHRDYLVVVSDDLAAVLILGRAGRPTKPKWRVIWHGASLRGAQRGSGLRARVLPEILDQADRMGVTLTVAVPRKFWGIARRELPGSRTRLALPWVRFLAAGADWRRRSEPTVPVTLHEVE